MTAILTVQDLEKSFGTRRVLAGVSFAVHERDRIGLIGGNGAGKSTLIRTAFGLEEPDAGKVTRQRGLRVEYVPQEPAFDPDATVAAALDRGPEVPLHEIETLAAALQLPPRDRRIGALSLGERRRVALGHALLGRAELLALDEPTNHLDARTVEWLEERLAAMPGALLLVTHDRYFLDRVATRILELDRGQLFGHEGGYTAYLERQAERLALEAGAEQARLAFIRNELDWIRATPQARSTKQKARIDRFDAAVSAAPGAAERAAGPITLRLPTGGRLGKTILELKRLARARNGKILFRDLTLTMKPGDRIGIVGPNGVGKTTLIRTILGLEPPDAGEVVVGLNTRFSYLEQGRTELDEPVHPERGRGAAESKGATVLEEVADGNDHVMLEDGPVHVRTFLRMLAFADEIAATPIRKLSGGERNRVQLARLLRRGGNLLVLDEPTNDLDLVTLGVLEEALVEFGGCVLVVSHDRWFLDRVATGILAFEGDGEVIFYEGDYSSYSRKRRRAAAAPAAAAKAPPAERVRTAAPRKLTFKERQELGGIEEAIHTAEARVAELEATLQDPAVFRERAAEVPSLVADLDAARAEVAVLFDRWQELEELAKVSP